MSFETLLLYIVLISGAVFLSILLVYIMRKREGENIEKTPSFEGTLVTAPSEAVKYNLPYEIGRSVADEEAQQARKQLRVLEVEYKLLGDAIRYVYEANIEGKISTEERDSVSQPYKERIKTIRDTMSQNESIITLHDLEGMQEQLLNLFNERFDELNQKVGELRGQVVVHPIDVKPVQVKKRTKELPPSQRKKPATRKKVKPKRTEAEKRIEHIRTEIEKALERLGQMEIET